MPVRVRVRVRARRARARPRATRPHFSASGKQERKADERRGKRIGEEEGDAARTTQPAWGRGGGGEGGEGRLPLPPQQKRREARRWWGNVVKKARSSNAPQRARLPGFQTLPDKSSACGRDAESGKTFSFFIIILNRPL